MPNHRGQTQEERLRLRISEGGPDAVRAAVDLMERHDPDSLEQALDLIPPSAGPTPLRREVIFEAWDRYFHIRNMSWE